MKGKSILPTMMALLGSPAVKERPRMLVIGVDEIATFDLEAFDRLKGLTESLHVFTISSHSTANSFQDMARAMLPVDPPKPSPFKRLHIERAYGKSYRRNNGGKRK